MPFKSLAQEGYLHSHPEKLGKQGLAEWDSATKGKHLPEHANKEKPVKETKKVAHEFSHSTVKHFKDGSHSLHHHHESDKTKDVKHAVADDAGMHASLTDNVGMAAPAPAESEAAAPAPPATAAPMPGM